MNAERHLIDAFARAADGFACDAVTGAAANLLLNVLRQSHPTLGTAEEELDGIVARMKQALRARHYHEDGRRNDRRIILPSLAELLRA